MKPGPRSGPRRQGCPVARGVFVAAVMLVGAGCSTTSPESGAPPTTPGARQPAATINARDTATTSPILNTDSGSDALPVAVSARAPDKAGAKVFALEVAELPEFMFYADNTELTATFQTIFHPDYAAALTEQLIGELAPARAALAEAATLERTWFIVRALSSEVTAYDKTAGTAVVEVWATQIFSRQGVAEPYSVFTTNTLNLAWLDGQWRVTGWDDTPGPTPRLALSEFPSTAAELDRQLDGHRLLHEDGTSP